MKKEPIVHYGVGVIGGKPFGEEIGEPDWFLLSPLPSDWPGRGVSLAVPVRTLPFPIAVKVGKGDGGRLVCTGLRMGADAVPGWDAKGSVEITPRALREIPLGQILRELAERLEFRLATFVDGGEAFEALADDHNRHRSHPGRRGYPSEFWEGIAAVYRQGMIVSRRNVSRYVAEHATDVDGRRMYTDTDQERLWENRERTARKWAKIARRKGYLGPARRGKAGEYPEDRPSRKSGQDTSTERKEKL
jgi:hypothetical protein